MAESSHKQVGFIAKIDNSTGGNAALHYYHFRHFGLCEIWLPAASEAVETVRQQANARLLGRLSEDSTFHRLFVRAARFYGYTLAFANCRLLARNRLWK